MYFFVFYTDTSLTGVMGQRVVPQSRMIGYNIREAHIFTQAGTQHVKVSLTPSLRQAWNM